MTETQAPKMYVRCPYCGAIALVEEIYCFSCGLRLKLRRWGKKT